MSSPPDPPTTSMWRDTNVYAEFGIPAINYGPGGGAGSGQNSIPIADLVHAAKIYGLTAYYTGQLSRSGRREMADKVEITVLAENYVDIFLPSPPVAQYPVPEKVGRLYGMRVSHRNRRRSYRDGKKQGRCDFKLTCRRGSDIIGSSIIDQRILKKRRGVLNLRMIYILTAFYTEHWF